MYISLNHPSMTVCINCICKDRRQKSRQKSSMNTVLFVNVTIVFSENLFLVIDVLSLLYSE